MRQCGSGAQAIGQQLDGCLRDFVRRSGRVSENSSVHRFAAITISLLALRRDHRGQRKFVREDSISEGQALLRCLRRPPLLAFSTGKTANAKERQSGVDRDPASLPNAIHRRANRLRHAGLQRCIAVDLIGNVSAESSFVKKFPATVSTSVPTAFDPCTRASVVRASTTAMSIGGRALRTPIFRLTIKPNPTRKPDRPLGPEHTWESSREPRVVPRHLQFHRKSVRTNRMRADGNVTDIRISFVAIDALGEPPAVDRLLHLLRHDRPGPLRSTSS